MLLQQKDQRLHLLKRLRRQSYSYLLNHRLLLSKTTIRVSSLSSFDQLITNYDNPRTKVTFASDIGIKMEVDIKIDRKNDILMHIDFYYKNAKIHYRKLDKRQLTLLINAYREYIIEFASKRSDITFSWSLLKDPKSLAKVFTKITKIRKVLQRYQDIHSLNIFTILMGVSAGDPPQDYIIARTALELDADIITIIPPELLLNTNETEFLMDLHSANVHLANYLFLYPLTRIFLAVKLIKNILRIISIPLWIVLSIIIFPKVITDYIFSVINFLGIPILLFRLVPKVTGLVVRKLI